MASVLDFLKVSEEDKPDFSKFKSKSKDKDEDKDKDKGKKGKDKKDEDEDDKDEKKASDVETALQEVLSMGRAPLKKVAQSAPTEAKKGKELAEKVAGMDKTAGLEKVAAAIYMDPILLRTYEAGKLNAVVKLAEGRGFDNDDLIDALRLGRKEFAAFATAGLQKQLDAAKAEGA